MAASLNRVELLGNLGRDPETRSFANGGKVVNLNIATSETWKDRTTGERQERVQWHSVAIFNEGLATIAEKYLRKGSKVYVSGQLETRKWQDQSGADRYTTEVVLRPFNGDLILLEGKQDSGGYEPRRSATSQVIERQQPAPVDAGELDDEIPF